jgi:hypothetical protein
MTLDEARTLVAKTTTAKAARGGFLQEGVVDYYESAAPAERARVHAAMETLLEQGNALEQELAARFWGSVGAPDDARPRLVRAYVAHGWDSQHPLADVLVYLGSDFSAEELRALRGAYFADPERQHRLAKPLLRRDDDGAVWREFAARVERMAELEGLVRAYEAILTAPDHGDEFFALLARKPEALLRALGARIGSSGQKKLFAAAGLS